MQGHAAVGFSNEREAQGGGGGMRFGGGGEIGVGGVYSKCCFSASRSTHA